HTRGAHSMVQSHAQQILNQKETEFDRYAPPRAGEEPHPLEIATDRLARALNRVEEAFLARQARGQEAGELASEAAGLPEENENSAQLVEGLTKKYQNWQQGAVHVPQRLDHPTASVPDLLKA